MRDLVTLAIVAALAGPAAAQHDHSQHASADQVQQRPEARQWTRLPLLQPAMARGGERSSASLRPVGIDAAELSVFAAGGPDERRRVVYPVGEDSANIQSASPKVGNYHWAMARQESDGEVRVASTVWYFSNPGPAPTDLLARQKSELEVVPVKLPREHSSYREAEAWNFLVRWQGAPLANQKVVMETEFGSRSTYVSDALGQVVVLFPRDFREQPGRGDAHAMGPRKAAFVLGTEYESDGKRYLTAFNYSYSPDPERERSVGWGAAFGLIGMVAALPLFRRRTAKADFPENKNV